MYNLVSRQIDSLFDVQPNGKSSHSYSGFLERETDYLISIPVPGIPLENIEISLDKGLLSVIGSVSKEQSKDGLFRKVERTWSLSDNINQDKVEATLENGLLLVSLPKAEKTLPKRKLIS